jgi:D-alanyl-D-alanine dipeptidase
MKPYRTMPIEECGEPLLPIPKKLFAFFEPHPYVALGAPYNGASPWMLRKGVIAALGKAQGQLERQRPGWKIMFFDAYRPNAVQAFMVEREFVLQAKEAGLDCTKLTASDREELSKKVFRLFGTPSENPATPPPHSTGGALDITLADENGKEADMGSPVDENSDRSYPDYFANATNDAGKRAHANRVFLNDIMSAEGFRRYEAEWWHFCRGDQMWAYMEREKQPGSQTVAIYGRADLLK